MKFTLYGYYDVSRATLQCDSLRVNMHTIFDPENKKDKIYVSGDVVVDFKLFVSKSGKLIVQLVDISLS